MREIKFRAWGKHENSELCFFWKFSIGKHIIGIKSTLIIPETFIQLSDCEQFTGLHDCEGTEIYEGDIVEVIMPCGTPNEITDTVQYNDVYGCFFLRTRYTSMCDLIQSDYNFKIIGNSHEAKQ